MFARSHSSSLTLHSSPATFIADKEPMQAAVLRFDHANTQQNHEIMKQPSSPPVTPTTRIAG
jgi:hypothetical protein